MLQATDRNRNVQRNVAFIPSGCAFAGVSRISSTFASTDFEIKRNRIRMTTCITFACIYPKINILYTLIRSHLDGRRVNLLSNAIKQVPGARGTWHFFKFGEFFNVETDYWVRDSSLSAHF